jgi:hypothetical protein
MSDNCFESVLKLLKFYDNKFFPKVKKKNERILQAKARRLLLEARRNQGFTSDWLLPQRASKSFGGILDFDSTRGTSGKISTRGTY